MFVVTHTYIAITSHNFVMLDMLVCLVQVHYYEAQESYNTLISICDCMDVGNWS